MSRDTYSEILDYILELLNTQKLYSLPILDTTASLKLRERGNEDTCTSISVFEGTYSEQKED